MFKKPASSAPLERSRSVEQIAISCCVTPGSLLALFNAVFCQFSGWGIHAGLVGSEEGLMRCAGGMCYRGCWERLGWRREEEEDERGM